MSAKRLLCATLATAVAMVSNLLGFSSGPLPRLTGGYGEETCLACHNSHSLNEGRTRGGMFHITGVPTRYRAGESYRISVVIAQPGQSRFGFQLAARSAHGEQAGSLTPVDGRTQVKEAEAVQYLMHTGRGSAERVPDGPLEYAFDWTAPAAAAGAVYFNAAGNAANDNLAPTGDFIYTAGAYAAAQGGVSGITRVDTQTEQPVYRRSESPVLINLPTPLDRNRGSFEFQIQHRFLQPVNSGAGEAFGVDFGANINLALSYSPGDRLTVGVTRTRFDKVVALTGSYEIRHRPGSSWQMDLVGGVEGESNFQRHYSTFLQLPTALDYGKLRFHLVPTLVLNSRRDQQALAFRDRAIGGDANHTLSLGVGVDAALNPTFSLIGEYVPRLTGFGGLGEDTASAGGGLMIRTFGHVFTVTLTNGREFTPARYATAGSQFLPNFPNDVVLGFNIYRRIP